MFRSMVLLPGSLLNDVEVTPSSEAARGVFGRVGGTEATLALPRAASWRPPQQGPHPLWMWASGGGEPGSAALLIPMPVPKVSS